MWIFIYRYLTKNAMDCVVIAPSKIPQQSGNRVKNDRRAMRFAPQSNDSVHSCFVTTEFIQEKQNGQRLISTGCLISLCHMLHSR